jgi:hypothetical protein
MNEVPQMLEPIRTIDLSRQDLREIGMLDKVEKALPRGLAVYRFPVPRYGPTGLLLDIGEAISAWRYRWGYSRDFAAFLLSR